MALDALAFSHVLHEENSQKAEAITAALERRAVG
jgi:hypothetical protein